MTVAQVAELPVRDLAAKNCALFLWITGPFLAKGAHIPVMRAWGFQPSGMGFVWLKLNKKAASLFILPQDVFTGIGFTTRKNAEFCLIGKRGKSVRESKAVKEPIIAPRREHSRKPWEFLDRVRTYAGPNARICELFARERRDGVDAWGDETDKF